MTHGKTILTSILKGKNTQALEAFSEAVMEECLVHIDDLKLEVNAELFDIDEAGFTHIRRSKPMQRFDFVNKRAYDMIINFPVKRRNTPFKYFHTTKKSAQKKDSNFKSVSKIKKMKPKKKKLM